MPRSRSQAAISAPVRTQHRCFEPANDGAHGLPDPAGKGRCGGAGLPPAAPPVVAVQVVVLGAAEVVSPATGVAKTPQIEFGLDDDMVYGSGMSCGELAPAPAGATPFHALDGLTFVLYIVYAADLAPLGSSTA